MRRATGALHHGAAACQPSADVDGARRVVDPDDRERAAVATGLKLMAELMAEIGWTTRFNQLTQPQARALAEAAIDGFQEAIAANLRRPDPEVPF